ncbi:MAG: DUF177 domain-containing protein [Acidobacteriaceae bacterium]|nr:DUF177 domain-containing protein [Acidobacteriaceae bacterium]
MFISLHELELRTVRFNVDIPAGEIDYDSKITQSSPLHTEGTAKLLNHSLGEIRVEGDLNVTVEATCDRCLETAKFPIGNHFDLVYMPAAEAKGRAEDEIDQGGLEVGYYEGGGLALEDILREVVLLALPMQLICDEACKGICPSCGQNRNQRDCGCQTEAVDDRWSKLRALRAEIGPHN